MSNLILPKSRNAGLGSEKLIFFERVIDGHIIIPPVVSAPLPVCRLPQGHDRKNPNCLCGYVRKEANSAKELEAVSRRKEAQRKVDFARVDEKHLRIMEAKMRAIRERLHTRMSQTHSQFEKDFIRGALKSLEQGEKSWRPRQVDGHFHIEEG